MNTNPQEGTTMTIKITDQARALPLYRHAQSEGQAIGLRLALEALTAETARQEERGRVAHAANPLKTDGAQHAFAAHVLGDVAKTVAQRFRA